MEMTVSFVCLNKKWKDDKWMLVWDILEENKEKFQKIMQGDRKDYFLPLRLELGKEIRKILTEFEMRGMESYIPEYIIENGKKYDFKTKAIIEKQQVVVYTAQFQEEAADLYLSDFTESAMIAVKHVEAIKNK